MFTLRSGGKKHSNGGRRRDKIAHILTSEEEGEAERGELLLPPPPPPFRGRGRESGKRIEAKKGFLPRKKGKGGGGGGGGGKGRRRRDRQTVARRPSVEGQNAAERRLSFFSILQSAHIVKQWVRITL